METFEEYLISKKIDGEAFSNGDNIRWQEFKFLFAQMHPKSLTAQKLFLINDIRRKYPLRVEEVRKEVKKAAARPVMKSKPQIEDKSKAFEGDETKTKMKPKVVARPVMKPKTKIQDGDETSNSSTKESEEKTKIKPKVKPKVVVKPRVVVKPKIKPPNKD